jgi:hypothetical protein
VITIKPPPVLELLLQALTAIMAAQTEAAELSPPADLTHFFSRTAKKRHPSEVKRFYKYFTIPGIQNLAGGKLLTELSIVAAHLS